MVEFLALVVEEELFKAKDFSKQSLENHSFTNCIFNYCNFSECSLRNATFFSCTFTECNFSLVKLEGCRLQDIKFSNCKIVGVEFSKSQKHFFSSHFKNCLIHYCNFSDLNMKNAQFNKSQLKESHFNNTCLINANFSEVNLLGTIFHQCDLSKADFSSSTQYIIDPQTNKIKKAKFSLPEVIGLLGSFDITIL